MHQPRRLINLAMIDLDYLEGQSLTSYERELARRPLGAPKIDLTGADTNVFPPPPYAIEKMTVAACGGGVTYTPYRGDPGVRSVVAKNIKDVFGFTVDPEQELILTPGTQSGLFTALSALVDEDVTVIHPDPDYLLTERIIRYLRGKVVRIPIDTTIPIAASLDLEKVEQTLRAGAKVFVFSNPNNPLGITYAPENLEALAKLLEYYDAWAIADELYCRLMYDGVPFVHLRDFPGMQERTITLLGPSKTESLSGYRLGVAIGPAKVIDAMEDILCISAMRAPAYAQHVLTGWLAEDKQWVAQRVIEYQHLRDIAVDAFRYEPFSVRRSAGTSYVFPRVNGITGTGYELMATLRRAGVVVNPGYQFGQCGVGGFRICIAQSETNLRKAIEIISEIVADTQKGRLK